MVRWITAGVLCALAAPALADPAADVKAVADAFARACAAQDVQAVLALYAEDATVVWPGRGQEAKGKAEIEPLVRRLFERGKDAKLVPTSLRAIPLDESHVADVGHWEDSFTTPEGKRVTLEVRTSEVLVKRDGKWLYLLDHASVGLPPARPAARRPLRRHRLRPS